MKIISLDEYKAGASLVNDVLTPFVNLEQLQILHSNGITENLVWYADDADPGILNIPVIATKDFRDRFGILNKINIDALHDNLENDTIVKTLCPNVTDLNIEQFRAPLRTVFKDLYSAEGVHVGSTDTINGLNLLRDMGIINQATVDTVLDITII